MTDPAFRPALLVVDMQEDFCPPNGSLAVASGRDITPLINTLLALPATILPLKIATKDWHPPNHISFASNHHQQHDSDPPKQPFIDTTTITNPLNPSEQYTTRLWPAHCIQHTPGAALIPELDTTSITHTIEKGTDPRVEMYSAFYAPLQSPRISDSGLADLLREAGTTHVYVVGLAADYCVRSTAADAVREGFVAVVIEEATRAVDPGRWEVCKEVMEREEGVRVVSWDGEEVRKLFAGE